MKYYVVKLGRRQRKEQEKFLASLNSLDKAILGGCGSEGGLNILRIIKCGKPYSNKFGGKEFASTDQVLVSLDKLLKGGLIERR